MFMSCAIRRINRLLRKERQVWDPPLLSNPSWLGFPLQSPRGETVRAGKDEKAEGLWLVPCRSPDLFQNVYTGIISKSSPGHSQV